MTDPHTGQGSRLLGGRYRLQHRLGRGGMAEVYAAHDEVLDRSVAVKLLLERFRTDEQFLARFRREAQHAAALNHPNVVAVYDTGEDQGMPYIVMEMVRGRSLADAVDAGGLTEDRALEVCAEVCAALGYAHSRGLVHRDVKPGNILLAEDGTVKVTDFGIARAIDAETVTQTAAVLGTAAYLSPEQAQGQVVDHRSDLYSLGVVLYEVLTGRQPFEGDSPVTVAYQHVQELPRPPRDWDAEISTAAEAIAVRAMAKNPANRYQSAEELRQDLLRARAGQVVDAPAVMRAEDTALFDAVPNSPRRTRTAAAERRRRLAGYAILGLFTLAAAGAAVFYLANAFTGDDTRRVVVPDLTGRTLAETQDLLDARGLRFRVAGEEFSETIEPNRVVRQEPVEGTQVAPDDLIRLFLSRGPQQVAVPQVVGLAEEAALRAIRDADLVPGERTTEFDADAEPGTILRIRPGPGERVPAGSLVDYTVSAGQETVRVLRVEGLSELEARSVLRDQEFEVLVVREFSDTVEEGLVIRQDPAPGTELERGAEVTIVVSQGPQDEPSPSPSPEPEPEPSPEPSPSPDDGGVLPPPPGGGEPSPEPSPSPTG